MTVEDRNEFRAIVSEAIGQAPASHPTKDEMQQAFQTATDHTDASIQAVKANAT